MRRLTLGAVIGLVPLTAWATDLATTVTNLDTTLTGQAGNGGDDEGRGVAIDSSGSTAVVGRLDGLVDHGDDALLAVFEPGVATAAWTVLVDGGLADGITRVTSTDVFHGVAIDDADNVVVAGELSGSLADGWSTAWYIGAYTPAGVPSWSDTFQDSTASLVQAAHGVAVDPLGGNVVGAGWSYRSATTSGRWLLYSYVGTTGLVNAGPIGYDLGKEIWAPDQAWDVAIDADGEVYVVGAVGIDGSTDPTNRDYDWVLRKYDADLGFLWEMTWSGLTGHDDVARSVAVDADGNVIVAGFTNAGSDNDTRADFDWLVIKYDGETGEVLWDVVWDSLGGGVSEKALAVDVDANGDALVGGSWVDAGGVTTWRLAHLSGYDGAELGVRTWTAEGELLGVDERDGQIALTGWELGALDRDLVLRVLDEDVDGDGTGDYADGCPDDVAKTEPLTCGCGESEEDSDGDAVQDCVDVCPDLPEKWDDEGLCGCDEPDTDRDTDGTVDCEDNCPDDPNKTELGICGCDLPDDDKDEDGVVGCDDACSNTPAGTPVGDDGCPLGGPTAPGTGDTASGDGVTDGGEKGCGCTSAPGGASWLLGLLTLAMIRRRRD